jgi:8-oxo-dGTP pyrophosphatase MutT (NUDIX family)
MALRIRNSVKIILLNEKNDILLICADDPKTTTPDGKYHGKFWFPVGGEIEEGESIEEAAIRELHEETGITEEEVKLGPIVWYGEFDYILKGVLTRQKETFIIAKTKKNNVSFTKLDHWEKNVLLKLEWFSLEKIKNCNEIIYPVPLTQYLPDIIAEKYPEKPIEIDLSKQPDKK